MQVPPIGLTSFGLQVTIHLNLFNNYTLRFDGRKYHDSTINIKTIV